MYNPNIARLLEMLSYARPADSPTTADWEARYLLTLPGAWRDTFGNIHVEIGADSRVLWSAHTDTVADFGGRQTLHVSPDRSVVQLSRKSRKSRNCLGADNTAGVWILTEMIGASVPGHYVFHYAEERGGIGSSDLAHHHGSWLRDRFDYAIAFDRRGTSEVITHQGCGRCASDSAGSALADLLAPLEYAISDGGIFTDTANYADDIPECFNLSAGTAHEHRPTESLDLVHVGALARRMVAIGAEVGSIPVVRERGDYDYAVYVTSDRYYGSLPRSETLAGFTTDHVETVPLTDDDRIYLSRDYARVQKALAGSDSMFESWCDDCGARYSADWSDSAGLCDDCYDDRLERMAEKCRVELAEQAKRRA